MNFDSIISFIADIIVVPLNISVEDLTCVNRVHHVRIRMEQASYCASVSNHKS
jgi:hypothetical protein